MFRIFVSPLIPSPGLRVTSQVMTDNPVTIRRERIGRKIGRLGNQGMARLSAASAFILGLAV
jgi:mRNA interferase MazF